MGIEFNKRVQQAKILDPQSGYEEKTLSLETRWDPLTKRTVRVLDLPIKKLDKLDIEAFLKSAGDVQCPFCPGALENMKPSPHASHQDCSDFITRLLLS